MLAKSPKATPQAGVGPQYQYDLVCIGFGPASLAIAIALHDRGINARVLYIERQRSFVWHAGMLLPNARMQISFLKDLATLRDPRSKFTFINYLHSKKRLVAFTNLSTFLPLRQEYNDYMSWCASHFEQDVLYGHETVSVSPTEDRKRPIQSWRVVSRNVQTNETSTVTARHVVVAVGGKPRIPPALSTGGSDGQIIHSSLYSTAVPKILTDKNKAYNVAVIGGGQSAAEIFNDLQSRYPNSHITLFTGASALKPSDDSPLWVLSPQPIPNTNNTNRTPDFPSSVNEVFDPDRVDPFYDLPAHSRRKTNASDKGTNYGVVRPELLDRMYENMYRQRLHEPDQRKWQYRIVPWREVVGFEPTRPDGRRLRLTLKNTSSGDTSTSESGFDLAVLGTGYERTGHEILLAPTRHLLQHRDRYAVERDYRVLFREGDVADGCGVWLQGCCEDSHGVSFFSLRSVLFPLPRSFPSPAVRTVWFERGVRTELTCLRCAQLSDTLLSILAVRGGEMVDSLFPAQRRGGVGCAKL